MNLNEFQSDFINNLKFMSKTKNNITQAHSDDYILPAAILLQKIQVLCRWVFIYILNVVYVHNLTVIF